MVKHINLHINYVYSSVSWLPLEMTRDQWTVERIVHVPEKAVNRDPSTLIMRGEAQTRCEYQIPNLNPIECS